MNRFTVTPNPVQQGGAVQVCYDFKGPPPATSPVKVTIEWDGVPPPVEFELSKDKPCGMLDVPTLATGGLLVDGSGQSEDRAITVTP